MGEERERDRRRVHLSASSDDKLLEWSDIINEQIHESELLAEADQNEESTGMDGNAIGLLLKLLVKVQGTRQGRKLLANETCIKSCINACIVYWYSKQESTIYKYEPLKLVQLITRLACISQFLILFMCTAA